MIIMTLDTDDFVNAVVAGPANTQMGCNNGWNPNGRMNSNGQMNYIN
jgi:hypothetical protein|tara:strand:- start:1407 stop:1547 length:141 start_codon:yes stop_codon:yes gene_type:complete